MRLAPSCLRRKSKGPQLLWRSLPSLQERRSSEMAAYLLPTSSSNRAWAVLDSGCNAIWHAEVWVQNAQEKLADLSFDMPWRFAGLTASTHSHGAQCFPACLELSDVAHVPRTM